MAIKNKQIEVNSPFDINDQRLVNVSDPVNASDAVNFKTLTNYATGVASEVILQNNSYGEEIIVGSVLEDRSLIIDYTIERNGIFEEGYIRILNSDVELFSSHQYQNSGETGVTFGGTVQYTDGTITITFDVDDNATDAIFKYILRIIKI